MCACPDVFTRIGVAYIRCGPQAVLSEVVDSC
jgi:hypothetical protein